MSLKLSFPSVIFHHSSLHYLINCHFHLFINHSNYIQPATDKVKHYKRYLLTHFLIHPFIPCNLQSTQFTKLKLNEQSESRSTLSFVKFISSHFPSVLSASVTLLDATTIHTGEDSLQPTIHWESISARKRIRVRVNKSYQMVGRQSQGKCRKQSKLQLCS